MRILFFLTLFVTIGFSTISFAKDEKAANVSTQDNQYEYLKLFGDVYERVKALYVDELSEQELMVCLAAWTLTHHIWIIHLLTI
jgi:hypothetical protein